MTQAEAEAEAEEAAAVVVVDALGEAGVVVETDVTTVWLVKFLISVATPGK